MFGESGNCNWLPIVVAVGSLLSASAPGQTLDDIREGVSQYFESIEDLSFTVDVVAPPADGPLTLETTDADGNPSTTLSMSYPDGSALVRTTWVWKRPNKAYSQSPARFRLGDDEPFARLIQAFNGAELRTLSVSETGEMRGAVTKDESAVRKKLTSDGVHQQ